MNFWFMQTKGCSLSFCFSKISSKGGCALNGAKRGMGTNSNNIGSRIKVRRKALGLTQEGLAETLNTTVSYLFGETENSEPAGTGNSLDELIMGEVGMMSDEEKQVLSDKRRLCSFHTDSHPADSVTI